MTQEEKRILIKDLCGRLPYGVKVTYNISGSHYEEISTICGWELRYDDLISFKLKNGLVVGCNIKPYLRPMSSMTEKELKDLNDKYGSIAYFFIQEPPYYYGLQAQHSDIGSIEISEFSEIYDWLDAHHIDYRGLIPMGLALEAKEGMYEID